MNPQISFSAEEIKDNLSTPKFPKNKSIISIEKEETTLDTLKQHIDKIYNDKNTLNNDNINESKNEKNILLNSLINNNNSDLNNFYMSQFSFDEKSSNFLNKKENKENIEIYNNNLGIEGKKEKNNDTIKDNNSKENSEIKYITKLTGLEIDKNEDSNFDYELPLGSDNNPEFFNMISFPENIEEKKEKNLEKKMGIKDFLCSTEEIISKLKNGKEKIKLTPQRKKHNKINKKTNSAKLNENYSLQKKEEKRNEDNCFETKFSTSNKKINKILKFSSLLEENKTETNGFFTERNSNSVKSDILSNSVKNTNFSSKEVNSKKNIINKKFFNDNITIKPFTIEKLNGNENKEKLDNKENNSQNNKIKSNIIKDITLSYYIRKNKKIRNSVNFTERNNNFLDFNIDTDKEKIIYEKNLSKNDSRSFSISQKGTHSYSHSRNYKEVNNNTNNGTIPFTKYIMNKKLKNCVILLSKNKNKSIFNDYINRNNSLKNLSLSEYENFSQRSLDKKYMEGKTEKCSPFRKSKIADSFSIKTSSYKEYIWNKEKLMDKNNNNTLKKIGNKTINDYNNIEEIKKEKYIKRKIKINNSENNNSTNYMDFNNNQIIKAKGNLTQRNKVTGPVNIYSRKLIFIPSGNNNNNKDYSKKLEKNTIDNVPNKIRTLKKSNINKSYIIPKEKNIKILLNEKNSNNDINRNKDRKKFNDYFKEILSNININKSIMNTKTCLNNKKPKEQKEKHKIRKLINLTNINMNSKNTKAIPTSIKTNNKEFSHKYIINKINNNKIRNNNYLKNNRINNNKIQFTQSKKDLIEKVRNNILNYSINRNNKNNQIKNEVSIFIGDNKGKNEKKLKEKIDSVIINVSNNKNRVKQLGKNKKTIMNVNQYYSSYFIKK